MSKDGREEIEREREREDGEGASLLATEIFRREREWRASLRVTEMQFSS